MVALVVAAGLLFYAKGLYDFHFGFSQQRWQAAGEVLHGGKEGSLDNPRQSMVQDILAHYLKPGMTRAQVLALLGPADCFGYGRGTSLPAPLASATGLQNLRALSDWSRRQSQSQPLLQYMAGWGLLDPISLDIRFDNHDVVSACYVVEH